MAENTSARDKKVDEWRAKGYSPALIKVSLKWADKWRKGIAKRFVKDLKMRRQVENSLFSEALELSEHFIEAMAK